MKKIITYETLRNFAYSNDALCKTEIKGIVLSFFGLGGAAMFSQDPIEGTAFARQGILYVIPYYNPWAWMNAQAVAYTDEIIDVLIEHYHLPKTIPIVSTGGSMGGLSALVYTAKAKYTPVACVANCPVCDLPYHFTERPDLPRTLYSAFYYTEGDVETALKTASPMHLVDAMPNVKYYIFHCDRDEAVNKERHSDVFVEKMSKAHTIQYHIVPDKGHCELTKEMKALYNQYMLDSILQ